MKKIGRIAKGEEVIIKMLAEDLQDLFEKMVDLKEDAVSSEEDYREDKSEDNAKAKTLKTYESLRAKMNFWQAVHERYGYWQHNLGVRDGYALVTFEEAEDTKPEVPDIIRRILKDIEE